MVTFHSVSMMI